MKQPKKPNLSQKKMIVGAGLNPDQWSVRDENKQYLYLVAEEWSSAKMS